MKPWTRTLPPGDGAISIEPPEATVSRVACGDHVVYAVFRAAECTDNDYASSLPVGPFNGSSFIQTMIRTQTAGKEVVVEGTAPDPEAVKVVRKG